MMRNIPAAVPWPVPVTCDAQLQTILVMSTTACVHEGLMIEADHKCAMGSNYSIAINIARRLIQCNDIEINPRDVDVTYNYSL